MFNICIRNDRIAWYTGCFRRYGIFLVKMFIADLLNYLIFLLKHPGQYILKSFIPINFFVVIIKKSEFPWEIQSFRLFSYYISSGGNQARKEVVNRRVIGSIGCTKVPLNNISTPPDFKLTSWRYNLS